MAQNKTAQYLKYAIGEVFLVVIGILIALQLNTWNQGIQNRKLEKEYLNRFILDLETDSEDLLIVIEKAAINIKLSTHVLEKLDVRIDKEYLSDSLFIHVISESNMEKNAIRYGSSIISFSSFGDAITKLRLSRAFDVTTVTINDLTSNGKMEVIRNKALRSNIQYYYGVMSAHEDYNAVRVAPSITYFDNLLRDLAIPPFSKQSLQEIQSINNRDPRFKTVIQYIMKTNLDLLRWSSQRKVDIEMVETEIREELNKN